MLEKNKKKKERKEKRHAFMGRPVRFEQKTKYKRKGRRKEQGI